MVDLISQSISDIAECDFHCLRDNQDNPYSSSYTLENWESKTHFSEGLF